MLPQNSDLCFMSKLFLATLAIVQVDLCMAHAGSRHWWHHRLQRQLAKPGRGFPKVQPLERFSVRIYSGVMGLKLQLGP